MGMFDSIGSSGLVSTRQGRGRVDNERHPNLRGRKAASVMREMHDNNSEVGSSYEITEFLLRRVKWNPKPPKAMAKDAQALECAEFVGGVYGDIKPTFSHFLSDALRFVPFGWGVFEKVYKVRRGSVFDPWASSKFNDNLIGLAGLMVRPQETLEEWVFDDRGNAVAMIQRLDTKNVTIPLSKCLHIVTKSNCNDPEGRSYYRNAVRSWEFLRRKEEDEAIGFSKDMQGVPIGRMPADYFNKTIVEKTPGMADTLKDCRKTMAGLKRNKYEYLLWPAAKEKGVDSGWEIDQFKVGNGHFEALGRSIERNQREVRTVIFATQFLMLAQGEAGGSRALGASQIDLYQQALEAILDNIEESLHAQVTTELCDLNGFPPEKHARWTHTPVSKKDVKAWVEMLTKLAQAGILTPDDPLEDHVREEMELPERSQDVSREEDEEADVAADLDDDDEPENEDQNEPEKEPEPIGKGVFVPSEEMAAAAVLALKRLGKMSKKERERAVSPVLVSNARLISKRTPMTVEAQKRLAAFFEHHEINRRTKEWREHGPGWIAWNAMGGDAGKKWAGSKQKAA